MSRLWVCLRLPRPLPFSQGHCVWFLAAVCRVSSWAAQPHLQFYQLFALFLLRTYQACYPGKPGRNDSHSHTRPGSASVRIMFFLELASPCPPPPHSISDYPVISSVTWPWTLVTPVQWFPFSGLNQQGAGLSPWQSARERQPVCTLAV